MYHFNGCDLHLEIILGIPSSSPYPNYTWSGPSGSTGDLPITAHFVNKNQRMNLRTIAIITLSAFVVLVVFTGAIAIVIRWRKSGRPSIAVGPAFTSSINKRSGMTLFIHFALLVKIYLVEVSCNVLLLHLNFECQSCFFTAYTLVYNGGYKWESLQKCMVSKSFMSLHMSLLESSKQFLFVILYWLYFP